MRAYRKFVEKSLEQPDYKGQGKNCVGDDQRQVRIQELDLLKDEKQRQGRSQLALLKMPFCWCINEASICRRQYRWAKGPWLL